MQACHKSPLSLFFLTTQLHFAICPRHLRFLTCRTCEINHSPVVDVLAQRASRTRAALIRFVTIF